MDDYIICQIFNASLTIKVAKPSHKYVFPFL